MKIFPEKSVVPSCLLVFMLVLSYCQTAFSEQKSDLDRLIRLRGQEIQKLLNERKGTLSLIEEFKKREFRVREVLNVLNESIETNRNKLSKITGNIESLQIDIVATSVKIAQLNGEIETDKENIDRQLQALFYIGRIKKMTHFIGLNSFENYFRNQRLLQNSTKLDVQILNRLNLNLQILEQEEKRQMEQKKRLMGLRMAEEDQKRLLDFELQQQRTYLQHIRVDRSTRIKYLREIQVDLERLNDTLFTLEEKKENRKKSKSFRGFRKRERSLPSPVKGKLVHRFGRRQSPFYTLYNRGVLVETYKEEEVQSILPGKVVWAGPMRGYKNVVILDHGKGSLSVYGNLDGIFVMVDDIVDQKYTLGTVAYNEVDQRNLFYFETRYNKRAINPVQWLKRPAWR
ncbi:MAG: peptidoglycan DD-metalloendopeptidase family protein [Proteobacteria bacterium]|nr:peptidoglycan DD-metalloendopeptidase family protein [Pseudomonadota bacterium]